MEANGICVLVANGDYLEVAGLIAQANLGGETRPSGSYAVHRVHTLRDLGVARVDLGLSVLLASPTMLLKLVGRGARPSPQAVECLDVWEPGRVCWICRLDEPSFRAVHRFAPFVPAELVILGMDSAQELAKAVRAISIGGARGPVLPTASALLDRVGALPPALREAVRRSMDLPHLRTIKPICAGAGVTRRTFERHCQAVGLSSPAEFLRQLVARRSG